MTKALPELITMDEAIRRAKADPNALSIEEVQARFFQSVKECEAEYGPDVPPLILRRGRPKAGEAVKPVKQKVVKMPADFWDELQGLAARQGITLHNAIRAALVEYVARKHA